MKSGKNNGFIIVLKCSLMIVGSIVGIGFVSGKEIVSFFYKYGKISYLLSFISCVILGVIIYKSKNNHKNKKCKTNNCACKNDSMYNISGNKSRNISNMFIGAMQIIIAGCMMAGIDNLLHSFCEAGIIQLNVLYIIKFSVIIFVFISLLFSTKIISIISSVFTGIIVVFMLIVIGFAFYKKENVLSEVGYNLFENNHIFVGLCSSIFYVSMNVLSCTGSIKVLNESVCSKKQKIAVSFIAPILLFVTICCILKVYDFYPDIVIESMPLLCLSSKIGGVFFIIYLFMLLVGAVSSFMLVVFSAEKNLPNIFSSSKLLKLILILSVSFLISLLGFDVLIEKIYPLIGALYLVFCLFKFACWSSSLQK